MRKARLALLVLVLSAPRLQAQVTVAPVVVGMGDRDRFASYLVLNQGLVAQEITVDTRFGFPVVDTLTGETRMVYGAEAGDTTASLDGWVRAFPRRFLLPPGQRQTVRLLVSPPAGLPDGVYWTRLITTSLPQSPRIDSSTARGVRMQITIRLEQVTTALYRHGSVNTGVELGNVRTERSDSAIQLFVPLTRTGNAPFLGTVRAVLQDAAGHEVARDSQYVGVYRNSLTRLRLPTRSSAAHAAAASVDLIVETGRRDIPPEDVVSAPPLRRSFPIPPR